MKKNSCFRYLLNILNLSEGLGFFVFSFLLMTLSGQAQAMIVTITTDSNGVPHGGSLGPQSSGGDSIPYYYYVGPIPSAPSPALLNFSPLDITKGSLRNAGVAPAAIDAPSLPNRFDLTIQSTQPLSSTPGAMAVVVFQVVPNTNNVSNTFITLASINGQPCSVSAGCYAQNIGLNSSLTNPSPTQFYAVRYPGPNAPFQIGFYPKDICSDLSSALPNFCAGSNVQAINAQAPISFQLNVSLMQVNEIQANAIPTALANGSDTSLPGGSLTFTLETDLPQDFMCPEPNALQQIWSPGDGGVFLDMSLFQSSFISNGPPFSGIYVVGNLLNDAVLNSNFLNQNMVQARVSLQPNQFISNLVNSTPSVDLKYSLSFIGQDKAGVGLPPTKDYNGVAYTSGQLPRSCQLTNVMAASIGGTLKASDWSLCLTESAYAADDSSEAPITLLRNFRDQVLTRSPGGHFFIKTYYALSAQVSPLLIQYPWLRLPVLLWLTPWEALAYVSLYPIIFLEILGVVCLGGGFILIQYRNQLQTRSTCRSKIIEKERME